MGSNVNNAPPDWEAAFTALSQQVSALATQVSSLSTELANTKTALQNSISSNSGGGGLKLMLDYYGAINNGTGNRVTKTFSSTYGGVLHLNSQAAIYGLTVDGKSISNTYWGYFYAIYTTNSYINVKIPFGSSVKLEYYDADGNHPVMCACYKYVKV